MKLLQFIFTVFCSEAKDPKKENAVIPIVAHIEHHIPVYAIVDVILSYYTCSKVKRDILLSDLPISSHVESGEALPFLLATRSIAYMPFLDQHRKYRDLDLDIVVAEASRNNYYSLLFNLVSFNIVGKGRVMNCIIESGNLNIFTQFLDIFTFEEKKYLHSGWYLKSSRIEDPSIFAFMFENQENFNDYNLDDIAIYASIPVTNYLLERRSLSQQAILNRLKLAPKHSYELTKVLFGLVEGDATEAWKAVIESRLSYRAYDFEGFLELTRYGFEELNRSDLVYENTVKFFQLHNEQRKIKKLRNF